IEQLEEEEQYYLVETQVPAGYIAISPIPVNLSISDVYTPKPGTATQTTKPESGFYDWTQNASLILSTESGVKRTNASNTTDLTHIGVTANSDTEIIYYRITNNPGVELPSTGGPGTQLFTILGSILILGAGVLLWRRRRLI
ncbi:MAG: LPXTG cell wall anchor domain-containing protein, partial [Ruminococcus sp.]|nr:LPXTG cell wall anchor domain-containing protein [Ruminococcus sp.]